MKKIITLSTLFTIFSFVLTYSKPNTAQVCTSTTLTTQAEVDAFVCSEVQGDLTISGSDISNLNSLSALRMVNGGLAIRDNPALLNIDGLSSLQSVGGGLSVTNNDKLTDLNGFSGLGSIGSYIDYSLQIGDNQVLNNLDGFTSLITANGPIIISDNPSLETINGFSSMTSHSGDLIIRNNEALESINGFDALERMTSRDFIIFSVSLNFLITNNKSLTHVDGFSSLTTLESALRGVFLTISDNPALVDFNGLSSLSTIRASSSGLYSNRITITNNSSLVRIPLCGLTDDANTEFVIENNPSLTEPICPPVVCTGDVTLTSQAEVDAFNCTEVTGILTISGNDISNLDALSGLTHVGIGLIISDNTSLSNVNGLAALGTVKGAVGEGNFGIRISGNQVLTNLDGLSSLTEVVGGITIRDNPLLETINGFSTMTLVNGLWISNNNQLKSINGFNGVTGISGAGSGIAYLIIDNNPSLTNVDGLSSVRDLFSLTSSLIITNNASLSNIDGLSSLSTFSYIGSNLIISNNPALKNINGLASITQFGDLGALSLITIQNNGVLEDIDGLSNLRGVYGVHFNSRITITDNQLLMRCSGLYPLLVSIGWDVVTAHIADGSFQVKDNGAGCTMEDIIYGGPQTISAFSVINEQTGDQVYRPLDLADPEFSNLALKAHTFPSPVGSVAFRFDDNIKHTDNESPYVFSLPNHPTVGTHTVTADVYSEAHRKGEKGIGLAGTVTIINSAAVVSYDIVNTSGTVIRPLNEDDILYLDELKFQGQTIVANTKGQIGSVKFDLNNAFFMIQNAFPYTLTGDNFGTYFEPWIPQAGGYTLTATPYSKSDAGGNAGQPLTIHLTVKGETAIVSYDIVDTSGKVVRGLNEGDILYLDDLKGKGQTIVANTTGQIGSVKFDLNNAFFMMQNAFPYTLTGDNFGTYFKPWIPQAGAYTLTATPYSKSDAVGGAGQLLTIHFTVEPEGSTAVVSYDIVNTSGKFVSHLNEGDILYLDDLKGKGQTIVANTTGQIGSVKFDLNDAFFMMQNVFPYTLTGDNFGTYFKPWIPEPDAYTLTATPYSKSNAGGGAGRPLTIHYTVVENNGAFSSRITAGGEGDDLQGDGVSDVTIYPVPVDNELFVRIDDTVGKDAILSIQTIHGVSVYEGTYSKSSNIRTDDLKPGVYVLHVVSNNGFHKVAKFIKK